MQEVVERLGSGSALLLEAIAILVIVTGAGEAVLRTISVLRGHGGTRRGVWLHFARWLLLGLEFALAADIVRTAVSPTWDDLGQLAAIAGIRTFLNFFLERDIHDIREMSLEAVATDNTGLAPGSGSRVEMST